jgi:hypothetical protein
MSAVGSPEKASPFPIGYPVGGAVMAPPVAKPISAVKYTTADFDKENAIFRKIYDGKELDLPLHIEIFSSEMYKAADKTVVQCQCTISHEKELFRDISKIDTHLAVIILNKFLCDPKNPVERNVEQTYFRILGLLPKAGETIALGDRAEMRRRAINVSANFYKKPMMLFAKYLVDTKQAVDMKEAARKLTQNDACGNFVDAVGCEIIRLVHIRAKR